MTNKKRVQIVSIILILLAMFSLIKYFTLPILLQLASYKGGIDTIQLFVLVNTVISYAILFLVLVLSIALFIFAKGSGNKQVYGLTKIYLSVFIINTVIGIAFSVFSSLVASGTLPLPSVFESIPQFISVVGTGIGLFSLVLQLTSFILLILILVKNQSSKVVDDSNQGPVS